MQLSTERQDRLIRWLTASGIYYICLIAFYIDIGQDMGAEYFIPVFLPVMLALVLVQYGTRVPLFSWATLPNLFTGLAWCSAFPLLYTWTYHQDWYMSKICFDFLVGTSLFLLLTALEGALFRLGHEKISAFFMALLNLFGIVIPFIQYAYYFIVWHCLSPASLMALYLTNWRESIDFIESNVGVVPACFIIAGLALFLYACWRGHMAFARRLEQEDSPHGRARTARHRLARLTLVVRAADLDCRPLERRRHLRQADADLQSQLRGALCQPLHRGNTDTRSKIARHGHRRHRRISLAQLHEGLHQ